MVPRVGPVCLAVLLVLAGCTGSPSAESGVTETTATATTTVTPTTATRVTPDATTTANPTRTERPANATLDADELSAADRELLRRAVENGSVRVTRSNLTGRLTPDRDHRYARFDGTLYELSWQYGGFYGKYGLQNATRIRPSTVEPSDEVVAYENLTADARRLFDAARSGNESEMYGPDAFPDRLRSDYVTDDGDYYALEVVVGDYIVYRLSVTEVES